LFYLFVESAHHHEIHSDHKIVRRDLNEIKSDKKDIISSSNLQPSDPLKKLGVESEHKHSDTTHSAIGI
jgi:hypothetical protein